MFDKKNIFHVKRKCNLTMYTIHPCQSISVCAILHYLLSRWICISVSALYFSQYKLALFVASMDLCICAARYFSTDRELFRDLKITATDPGLQGVQLFVLYVFVCSFFLSVNLEFEEEESDCY